MYTLFPYTTLVRSEIISATQLANPRANPITVIRQNLQAMAPEFRAALPAHVSVEKFTRVAQTAIQNQPDLANVDRKSLFGAIVRLAQDGLLPDGREAAIVKFGNQAQAMPMIAGILKKVRQSGEVSYISAHVVYANRSEERRVEQECVSTIRTRSMPYH